MFSLLRRRQVLMLSVGSLCNNLGNWCALLAILGIASQRLHASALGLAALSLSWAIPRALLGPFPGLIVDRVGPKRVLGAAYALDAGLSVAFIFAGNLPVLLVIGFLHGVVFAFSIPAENAFPPRVVAREELAEVNALMSLVQQLSVVMGPAVGSLLIAAVGPAGALVGNVVSYAIAMGCALPLSARDARERAKARARDAVRHVRRHGEIRLLFLVFAAQAAAMGSLSVLEPIYVRDVLRAGSDVFAALQVPFGVGLVLGSVIAMRRPQAKLHLPRIASHLAAGGLATALYLATPSLVLALIASGGLGLAVAGVGPAVRSAVQVHSPEAMHGRVMALLFAVVAWVDMSARGTAGAVAPRVGMPIVGFVAGAILVIVAALVLVLRRFARRHEDLPRVANIAAFRTRPRSMLRVAA